MSLNRDDFDGLWFQSEVKRSQTGLTRNPVPPGAVAGWHTHPGYGGEHIPNMFDSHHKPIDWSDPNDPSSGDRRRVTIDHIPEYFSGPKQIWRINLDLSVSEVGAITNPRHLPDYMQSKPF